MATLSKEIIKKIEVGENDIVIFRFRRPTPEELNKFLAARYPTDHKHRMKDNSGPARSAFFDLLLTGIENLDDEQGPITAERKEEVPANWKNQLIFQAFEDVPVIDEKN